VGVLLASAALVAALVPSAASAAIPPAADHTTQMAIDQFRADVRSRVDAPYRSWLYNGRPAGVTDKAWNEAMIQKHKAEKAALKALDRSTRHMLKSYWNSVAKALRSPVLAGTHPIKH
jgi:hypothetical protein